MDQSQDQSEGSPVPDRGVRRRLVAWALGAGAVTVVFVGCLSPESAQTAIAALDQALADGVITEAEHSAAVGIIRESASGFDWNRLLDIGLAVLFTLTGVRIQRGPSRPSLERLARSARAREAIAAVDAASAET